MITTRGAMDSLREAELRTQVIMPLMTRMGFQGVHEWHASVQELGKDIIAWREDEFGARINTAVVAKAGRISGRVAQDVARQIRQAFNAPFQDPVTLEDSLVHNVLVVTNGVVPTDSIPGIKADVDAVHRRHVTFVDGDELWTKWCRYFPVATHQAITEAQERVAAIETPYRIAVELSADGQQLTIGERYPGQLEAEPLEVRGRFEVPNSPEGLRMMEQIDAMFTRGAPVDLPPGYFRVELPDALRNVAAQIYGEVPDGPMAVQITTVPDTHVLPIRIDIEAEDGSRVEFPFIELHSLQSGTEQVTLSNEAQPYPIKVTMVINFVDQTFEFNFNRKEEPIAAPLLLNLLRAIRIMSGACKVRIIDANSGIILSKRVQRSPRIPSFDQNYFDLVAAMTAVQQKTNKPIFIPKRGFTEDELETIGRLWWISREPKIEGAWAAFSLTVCGKAGDEDEILSEFAESESKVLRIEEPQESIDLFGTSIPLGRVCRKFAGARLENEVEARAAIAASNEEICVELRFAPGITDRMSIEYLDWEIRPRGVDGT